GIAVAGHVELLGTDSTREQAPVELLARRHHHEERPGACRLLLDTESLVDQLPRQARLRRYATGRADPVVKAVDGVRDIALLKDANRQGLLRHARIVQHAAVEVEGCRSTR